MNSQNNNAGEIKPGVPSARKRAVIAADQDTNTGFSARGHIKKWDDPRYQLEGENEPIKLLQKYAVLRWIVYVLCAVAVLYIALFSDLWSRKVFKDNFLGSNFLGAWLFPIVFAGIALVVWILREKRLNHEFDDAKPTESIAAGDPFA